MSNSTFQQRHEVYLPRQTMARGIELMADWLRPVSGQILTEQLADGYLQIDETPVKYLEPGHGKTKQGYFWVLRGRTGTVYHWADGRGHEHLLNVPPKSLMGNAVTYALGQWPLLEVYAGEGQVEIDNKWVENESGEMKLV